jgi:ABC-type proline/glycine betaine transport system permease subunit
VNGLAPLRQAFVGGLGIVLIAIIFDRISQKFI